MNTLFEIFAAFFKILSNLGKSYIEVRFLKTSYGIVSGIFSTDEDGAEELAEQVQAMGLERVSMYHTINKLSDEYVNNCIANGNLNKLIKNAQTTTKDSDIGEIRLIMIDLDPKRDSGVSSTDEEKDTAKTLLADMVNDLNGAGLGFPAYVTDSGNGYNAYYPVSFPNDKEHNKLIADFIKCLSEKYSNEDVDVDKSTKNPARIAKVPGSWSVKGLDAPDRPHRQCMLIKNWFKQPSLTADKIKAYLSENSVKTESKKKSGSKVKKIKVYDVSEWLDSHGLEYKVNQAECEDSACTIYSLKNCPFADHDNEYCSFLAQFEDMSVIFKCHHNHCTQGINEFISEYPLPKCPTLLEGDDNITRVYNHLISTTNLMMDKNKRKYIKINDRVLRYDSGECRDAFRKKALTNVGVNISTTGIETIHENIGSLFEEFASTETIGSRICIKDGHYYYAVNQDKSIHISDGKAEFTDKADVYFAYNPESRSQTEPDLSSPASDLPMLVEKVFNVSQKNRSRFLAQLCAFFIPDLMTPFLVLSGGHGTSKTTTARKIMKLVDPRSSDVVSMPDKEDDLKVALADSYISAFDNIDSISSSFSDILCIACTGGTSVKRKLYTDCTKSSIYLKTHVVLNGIGDFVRRSDLAERCNIIYLDTLSNRLTEKKVWAEFEAIKPKLLGSIFNTIAKGLAILPEIEEQMTDLPRMADFAQYGAAFIRAMGLDTDDFIRDYKQANDELIADCSSTDPFISEVDDFVVKHNGSWTGPASKLLEEIKSSSPAAHSVFSKYSASTLSRKLTQSSVDLKAVGVTISIKATTPKSITLTAAAVRA